MAQQEVSQASLIVAERSEGVGNVDVAQIALIIAIPTDTSGDLGEEQVAQVSLIVAAKGISSGHVDVAQTALIVSTQHLGNVDVAQAALIVAVLSPKPPAPATGSGPTFMPTFSYPLSPPTLLGPAKANLKKFDAIGENISPFDGSAEEQMWQDQHWELDLVWPEMTWDQGAAYDAFLGALHGKFGTFLWGPPLASAPRGSALGTPVCVGADEAGSNLLHTSGWTPSTSGLLLPGDFFQIIAPAPIQPALNTVKDIVLVSGQLIMEMTNTWTADQLANLPGTQFILEGLDPASDLNGLLLTVFSVQNFFPLLVADYAGTLTGGGFQSSGAVFAVATHTRLYQYVNPNPLASDASGNAVLDFFPSLREQPGAGTAVILSNPVGTFRLAENRREAPADKTKTLTFQLKAREAI